MSIEILLPKLGLTMEEGEIIEWCKQEGEQISKGDVLYVLETEKISYEFESPTDGILSPILFNIGESIPVGSVVAYLIEPGEKYEDIRQFTQNNSEQELSSSESSSVLSGDKTLPEPVPSNSRVSVTPLAKKIAREKEVELTSVQGSGPSGRIVAEDVYRIVKEQTPENINSKFEADSVDAKVPSPHAGEAGVGCIDKLVRFSATRKTIAKRMLASKIETAQSYMTISIDASAIVRSRKTFLSMIEKQCGIRLTLTDIFMKICGNAILSHPIINTQWTDKGVQYLANVHMGMAMDVDDGLLVPVIRNINQKNLTEIAADRLRLMDLCRSKKYKIEDISGSSVSMSTLGAFGIESFTSNINMPESAILAIGEVKDCPVVVDGVVRVQATTKITLTYDHRHIDGADAAKFMETLKSQLETPEGYLW